MANSLRPGLIALALRLALRELRGGFGGFYIFLACIALGTASIGAVNSISRAMTDSIAEQGKTLLAGDVRFELNNREANDKEKAYLAGLGDVAVSQRLRSMARLTDGSNQALVDIKAVDGAYPFYGNLKTEPSDPMADLLSEKDGTYGALVAPLLLQRLSLKIGDTIMLGQATLQIRGTIVNEPDSLSDGFSFAPKVILSQDALAKTGLIQPGSLVSYIYKIKLKNPNQNLKAIANKAKAVLPEAGWSVRTSLNAAPSLTENIGRFSQFLTLVGLTALIVGGVGVANAVRAFLDSKRGVIATFKCLGAPGKLVTMIYLSQIICVALCGIVIGLVGAAIAPMIAARFLDGILPVNQSGVVYPSALALAALFGLLTALAFAILPLGQARKVPATALFRDQGFEKAGLPHWTFLVTALVLFAALGGLAIVTAYDVWLAVIFIGAVLFAFLVLRLVSFGLQILARRAPRVSSPALRLAIGNIHRPGALTPSVVLSLGLGLTLLVAIALIDGNLRKQLSGDLPARAPNFFFIDIQGKDLDGFRSVLKQASPDGKVMEVPMLRGRILAFNGVDVSKMNVPAGGKWVLQGDRGITYSDTLPDNATLKEGSWWPKDYAGEPLVSFSDEEGKELGLKLGDTITVNVLGRNMTAKIANFRDVKWESMSINFVMVFSPNMFKGAPHAWLATLSDPKASADAEAATLKTVTNAFPTITSVRVKDALDIINQLIGQLATAIRAAASVALISSVLVLAGALAAGNRARIHDAVVLKTLGATRKTLITAFVLEYSMLGLATALFALFSGGAAAWFVVNRLMTLPFSFLPDIALLTVVIALVLTVGMGLLGTWRVLGQKAAPVLREL